MKNNKGFILLPLLLTAVFVVGLGFIAYKSNSFQGVQDSKAATMEVTKQVEITPSEDSYVTKSTPTQTYGNSVTLVSGGAEGGSAFLKFDLSPISGKKLSAVKLVLNTTKTSQAIHSLSYAQNTSWTESGLNYNNRPTSMIPIGSLTPKTTGETTVEFSSLLAQNSMTNVSFVTMVISSQSTDSFIFMSKEGSVKPKLVFSYKETVQVTANPTATSMPTPTGSTRPTASSMPTAMPSMTPTPTNGTAPGGGLGVGSGDGLEIGINLAAFNKIKADAAAGMYDRPCTAAEEDKTKWHPLVNVAAKCHYNSEHGDDPNYVNDIFGEPGAWFGQPGQSQSYPWQTFALPADTTMAQALTQVGTPGQKEVDLKPNGYYWIVRRDQTCDGGQWCITDSRLQFHFMTSHIGEVAVRYHSFSFEGRLCKDPKDKSTCGIYRTGEWTDHGQLFVPNSITDQCWNALNSKPPLGKIVSVASDNQYYPLPTQGLRDEMRCHKPVTPAIIKQYPNGYTSPVAEWWTHSREDFRYVVFVYNPISNVDPASPNAMTANNMPFCSPTDPNCRWTNSIMTAGQGYTSQIWDNYAGTPVDSNHDGRTDLTLGKVYLNRFGTVNKSCKLASLDCIPLEISNVIINNNPAPGQARYSNKQCANCTKLNHDLTPPGRPSWINWFQTMH